MLYRPALASLMALIGMLRLPPDACAAVPDSAPMAEMRAAAIPGPPAPIAAPARAGLAAATTVVTQAPTASRRVAMPWVAILHAESARIGRAPMAWTIAARLGAALAWDLADLPCHQTGASQPWGAFRSPPGYAAPCGRGAPAPGGGGAIGVLVTRWNMLYLPYALEGMDDLERPGRHEYDPSEEPSCPGN